MKENLKKYNLGIRLCLVASLIIFIIFLFLPCYNFSKTTELYGIKETITMKFSIIDLTNGSNYVSISSSLTEKDLSGLFQLKIEDAIVGKKLFTLIQTLVFIIIISISAIYFLTILISFMNMSSLHNYFYLSIAHCIYVLVLLVLPSAGFIATQFTSQDTEIEIFGTLPPFLIYFVIQFSIMSACQSLTIKINLMSIQAYFDDCNINNENTELAEKRLLDFIDNSHCGINLRLAKSYIKSIKINKNSD